MNTQTIEIRVSSWDQEDIYHALACCLKEVRVRGMFGGQRAFEDSIKIREGIANFLKFDGFNKED